MLSYCLFSLSLIRWHHALFTFYQIGLALPSRITPILKNPRCHVIAQILSGLRPKVADDVRNGSLPLPFDKTLKRILKWRSAGWNLEAIQLVCRLRNSALNG